MKKIIILTAVFFTIFSVSAQNWEYYYSTSPDSYGNSTCGNKESDINYLAGSVFNSGSGNYDMYMVKTDNMGNFDWEKTQELPYESSFNVIQTVHPAAKTNFTYDHVYGAGYMYNGLDKDMYMYKVDYDGSFFFEKVMDGGFGDDEINSMFEVDFSMPGFTGYVTNSSGNKDLFITLYNDEYFDISLADSITRGGIGDEVGNAIHTSYYNEIYCAGYTTSTTGGDKDVLFVRYDRMLTDFTIDTTFGGTGDDVANAVYHNDMDGSVLIAGYTTSFGVQGKDMYAILVNTEGEIMWEKTYGFDGDEEAMAIDYDQQNNSSAYVISGYTTSFGTGDKDAWVLKLNPATGDTIWTRVVGEPSIDEVANGVSVEYCSITIGGTKGSRIWQANIPDESHYLVGTTVDAKCNGDWSGEIQLAPVAMDAGYTIYWNGSYSTQSLNNLGIQAGQYIMEATYDDYNCTFVDTFYIDEPAPLNMSILKINSGCFGECDKGIDIQASGGIPPYTIHAENMQGLPKLKSNFLDTTLTGYCANDEVEFFVEDSNGCYTMNEYIIFEEPDMPVVVTTSATDNSCFNSCDGSAGISASGGAEQFSYEWDDALSQTSDTITDLCAGIYNVTITDTTNCIVYETLEVGEPAEIIPSFQVEQVHCYGQANGSIVVSCTGGVGPYSYLWSTQSTSDTVTGLDIGMYYITIQDVTGCLVTDSIEMTQPDSIQISSLIEDVSCYSANNGNIEISTTGGTLPYEIICNNGESSEYITNLAPGTYEVTITDFNNCTQNESFTINEPAALDLTMNPTAVSCFGLTDGILDANINGGTTPYYYSWSTGSTDQTVSNQAPGNYNLTVFDANGCSVMSNTIIEEPDSLTIELIPNNILCNGETNGSI
ncbi:MAG: hypothetical protein C0594_01970, partial [Marinilabiliales bacterium]